MLNTIIRAYVNEFSVFRRFCRTASFSSESYAGWKETELLSSLFRLSTNEERFDGIADIILFYLPSFRFII